MKLFLIGFLLLFSIMGFASVTDSTACDHCTPKLTGASDSAIPNGLIRIAKHRERRVTLAGLASAICVLYQTSRNLVEDTENKVRRYLSEKGLKNITDRDLLIFFNDNKDALQCPSINGTHRNFIKVAIERRRYKSLIYKLLISRLRFDNKQTKINFNAVDIIKGKPETVLDYIDFIIADAENHGKQYIKEVRKLRKILADTGRGFSAKNFVDLPKNIKAKYNYGKK